MLYERWRQIVQAKRNELALKELSSGRSWTFAALAAAGEKFPLPPGEMVCPQGNSAEFILSILSAWRANTVVCPLEPGQTPPAAPKPPANCIHLKTTSATTGSPRLIAFTGEQLAADVDNIVATMGLRPDWPNLGVISMAHSYGFSNLVLPLLLHGIPLILAPAPLPQVISKAAAHEPALTVAGVPVLWRAWHEARVISPNIRLAISAGAPLTAALEQAVFQGSGLKIHNFYGASECGGIAYDASNQPRTDSAYVGSAMQNVKLSIAKSGCLLVKSAAVGETYWPAADVALGHKRFETSDLAELQGDQVFLRGRVGDLINMAGRKVSAQAIESVLAGCPDVADCLVFGVSVEAGAKMERERIVACVVAKGDLTPEDLKKYASSKLPAWQVPRAWWFVHSLTTNSRGKISRADWKTEYLKAHNALKQGD